RDELALCGISAGDTVGVLTQGMMRGKYAEAFQDAARALDAATFHVDIPSTGAPDDGGELGVRAAETGLDAFPATLVETFSLCDLMVDLVFLLWSAEQQAIRAAQTKIISCVEPPQALRRLFADDDLRRAAPCRPSTTCAGACAPPAHDSSSPRSCASRTTAAPTAPTSWASSATST